MTRGRGTHGVYTQGLTRSGACRVLTCTPGVLSTQPPTWRVLHKPARALRPAACAARLGQEARPSASRPLQGLEGQLGPGVDQMGSGAPDRGQWEVRLEPGGRLWGAPRKLGPDSVALWFQPEDI